MKCNHNDIFLILRENPQDYMRFIAVSLKKTHGFIMINSDDLNIIEGVVGNGYGAIRFVMEMRRSIFYWKIRTVFCHGVPVHISIPIRIGACRM